MHVCVLSMRAMLSNMLEDFTGYPQRVSLSHICRELAILEKQHEKY